MIKIKNLILVVFLSVILFGVLAKEIITASAISLNETIANLENKAKEKNSSIVKITSAGGKNYVRASAIIEKINNFFCMSIIYPSFLCILSIK
ncbi:MAG: hypothetical protein AB8W37_00620 [Arsenophonus endosymbiont of Dermacentor nuttalli]